MGRPKKSEQQHKQDGTFREDRHSESVESVFTTGVPQKPKWLNAVQSRSWEIVTKNIPDEYLGELDTLSLEALVICHARWMSIESSIDQMHGEIFDKNGDLDDEYLNNRYKLECMSAGIWKKLVGLLDRFGMSPAARTKITKVDGKPRPKSKSRLEGFLESNN